MLLIEHFTSGRLPGCSGGESLRTTLSECLMCTPMRITKKLSATHAIGKCCFKKKGELSAKERVKLEEARRAFIASVDKRPTTDGINHRGSSPTKKRSRTSSDDWFNNDALIDPSDSKWFEDVKFVNENNSWIPCHERDADITRQVKPSVSARIDNDGRTKVRVVATDRTGLIGDISRALEIKNLGIASCIAETLPGDVAHDEFDVIHADTKEPFKLADFKEFESYLENVIARRENLAHVVQPPLDIKNSETSSLASTGGNNASSQKPIVKENASIHSADHEFRRSPSPAHSTQSAPATTGRVSATTLQVTVPDRPGLLKQIIASLSSLSLSVVGAKIETVEHDGVDAPSKTALDTFDVVDAETGGPVLDPERLRAIEERLARDLEQHQNDSDTPMADRSVFSPGNQPIEEDNTSFAWGDVGISPRNHRDDASNNEDSWLYPNSDKNYAF